MMSMGKLDLFICQAMPLLALNTFLLCLGSFSLGLGLQTLIGGDTSTLASYLAHTENLTKETMSEEINFSLNALAMAGTILGAWLTLLGLLGVSGTLTGIDCLLMLYVNLATITLMTVLGMGFVLYCSRDKVVSVATVGFKFGLYAEYGADLDNPVSENLFTKFVDRAQMTLGCCGFHNYTEFQEYSVLWREATQNIIPVSCCRPIDEPVNVTTSNISCLSNPSHSNSYISTPCFGKIEDWFVRHKNCLIGAWLGVTLFLITAIGLSLSLMCCCCCCGWAD